MKNDNEVLFLESHSWLNLFYQGMCDTEVLIFAQNKHSSRRRRAYSLGSFAGKFWSRDSEDQVSEYLFWNLVQSLAASCFAILKTVGSPLFLGSKVVMRRLLICNTLDLAPDLYFENSNGGSISSSRVAHLRRGFILYERRILNLRGVMNFIFVRVWCVLRSLDCRNPLVA